MVNIRTNKKNSRSGLASYGHQSINASDINSVVGILESAWLTQGPKVKDFEEKLAKYCGAKYAVAVNSGTAALHIAYLAAGIKAGDEVITTPNTFVATSNMILALRAKPVFCDIKLDTYNIDNKKIEKLITKKTKAIVPVDFAGHPCDMEAINKIAKKHKLIVIEDACHALGASYKNKKTGSLAHMTVFSFHPVKHITTGEGGAVLTNNPEYYERLKMFRSHGIIKDKNGFNSMIELGFNYRMSDIGAALGVSQLKRLDSFVKKRQALVNVYIKNLKEVKDIILPVGQVTLSSWHLFVIRLKNLDRRVALMDYLKKAGIGSMIHYPAVYSHPYYRNNGYQKLLLPNEDIYQKSCLTLPLHPELSESDILYTCSIVKKFFNYA
ncbi:MAG: UDP-4-amino-4,6-dideoxy-N-acetyl-beta-L-altrosamine transaminase [Candidatus Paceibacterota bacterium]|jgi:UDP-4-amino-4,6-dideoxy-N-acetyl-beta-L-altrosamine transaminase